jgi:endonuclease YncB( thermonuclease family)
VDGDTFRFPDRTVVRILALDAEEVFKNDRDRRAAAEDFGAYARAKRGDSVTPVKFATPAGEEAKAFAARLVAEAKEIRLERDAEGERTLDAYGRLLAHVVLVGPTGERLFAEELIRTGRSPYFVKYGRSRRFDERLRAAEDEAIRERRGVFGDDGPAHYPDYEERLAWWRARADQIDAWLAAPPAPERVRLGVPSESERLDGLVGREVTVFGEVREQRTNRGSPWILWLMDRPDRDFPVVWLEEAVFARLDLAAADSRYLTVRGVLTLYEGTPQIVVSDPEQVATR